MSDIHKLSGAYALDAVDEFERAQFERHLAECEDCRLEVASLRETTALLAESVAVPPPASLRDSVLAGITQVRPLPPVVEPPARRAAWFPLLVAASVAAILGVGVAIWQPWATSPETDSLTAAEQVLRAPDAEEVSLDLGEAGRATVVRSVSVGKAVIQTEDMVSAPSGKDYEIWLQVEGEMVPAGLMEDDPDLTMVLEGDAAEATAAGITVEPDGGSPAPTSEPIALFDFSSAT
ncbi:anti-sigma factor [Nocardioides piscis]|uniref:Regulator of SigK n=1 Tax=Nocardioides piscis TaxID=2714938 RepID=A0A6G7YDZ6_9ACTN|nr:anti-sigma factor [Nocardioides piscis]QIK75042.1 anti-sigma factor [Nocardioides piscis]